jgi:adhesin transport system outer membrane protein
MSRRGVLRMIRISNRFAIAFTWLSIAGTATAGTLATLPDAAREAVSNNPRIRSAVNEFHAAEEQIQVAKGGYLPRIDLEAGVGYERIDDPVFGEDDFSRTRFTALLNQMLFDGWATRNRVKSYSYASRARYYEVFSTSESIAADVADAYYGVLAERELVELSKENYAAHRLIHQQIERRVAAGVSRRVDYEQAFGRLALSESNLLTDITNLHDASRRYQSAVGESPAPTLAEPELSPGQLPPTIEEATALAYRESPTMNAAIAGVWSADRAAAVTKAAFLPRLDLRARQDLWDNDDPIAGRYEEEGVIELVMSYNLYNGGSDRAERRRMQFKAAQAADQRDDACRVIREDVGVAYNELRALEEQMTYLDRHQQSIGRAREAYRRQFDIGQRTLLDMLDTENEYYQARRAYVLAKREHDAAYTRALASMGVLVRTLELGGDLYALNLPDAGKEETPDMTAACPPDPIVAPAIDKEAIFRDAMARQGDLQRYDMVPEAPNPALVPPAASTEEPAREPPPRQPARF